jgi:hypothetical protein
MIEKHRQDSYFDHLRMHFKYIEVEEGQERPDKSQIQDNH